MVAYALRRLLQAIPLVAGVVIMLFVLLELTPGDPVQAFLGDFPATDEYRRQVTEQFHLDDPAIERFGAYAGNLLKGNLGYSFANRQPVWGLIVDRLGNTLILMGTGLSIAAIGGVILGMKAATTQRQSLDTAVSVVSLAGFSIPVFWLGQILIIMFAITLGWLPVQGMESLRTPGVGLARLLDVAKHLVLPATALAVRELAINSRMMRASMRDVLDSDYLVTARSKGLTPRRVIWRHGFRNAVIPVLTVVGFNFGHAIAGTVLVETVFSWPGMGRLVFNSIVARDNQVIIGVFIVTALTVIVVNLITDLMYGVIDPRVRTA